MDFLLQHAYWVIAALLLLLVLVVAFTLRQIAALWARWRVPFKRGKHYRCRVIKVSDGDTVTCRKRFLRRGQTTLRLAYIDAPELKQQYGASAKNAVQKLLLNKNIRVTIVDTDKYGRHVGDVYRYRRSISEHLIRSGHAWAYPDYARNAEHKRHLLALQQQAKQRKRGLWRERGNQNPQDFRRNR